MKTINLTQGYKAEVDDEDYPHLSKYKWRVHKLKYTQYAIRVLKKNNRDTSIYMHREIMGNPENVIIDHKDGNGLNNCKQNLRIANRSLNAANSKNIKVGRTSFKGVTYDKRSNRYYARIKVKQKQISLGGFPTALEAAKTYNTAALKYFGVFAILNEVP